MSTTTHAFPPPPPGEGQGVGTPFPIPQAALPHPSPLPVGEGENHLDPVDFRLLNEWQRALPLVSRPFAEMARALGISEEGVIARLRHLKSRGHISRVGAVFRPHVLGWSTLAAVAAPPERMDAVARVIDACPEVNHNYEREHAYNLWFVVTAPSAGQVADVLAHIHRQTGLKPLNLPMVEDYHIDLGFDLGHDLGNGHLGQPLARVPINGAGKSRQAEALRAELDSVDYALAAALEPGLPLTSRPYAELATFRGLSEAACIDRITRLIDLGVMRRFGVVVRHRELGYTANAMVVWDVPDSCVNAVGRLLGTQSAVTLCYQRPRRPPDWHYNLFSMVHGRDRDAVLAEIARLRADPILAGIPCQPLFSKRRFKQRGARYSSLEKAA
jgi:DNA-binding Lrp family transcriptional regulator